MTNGISPDVNNITTFSIRLQDAVPYRRHNVSTFLQSKRHPFSETLFIYTHLLLYNSCNSPPKTVSTCTSDLTNKSNTLFIILLLQGLGGLAAVVGLMLVSGIVMFVFCRKKIKTRKTTDDEVSFINE